MVPAPNTGKKSTTAVSRPKNRGPGTRSRKNPAVTSKKVIPESFSSAFSQPPMAPRLRCQRFVTVRRQGLGRILLSHRRSLGRLPAIIKPEITVVRRNRKKSGSFLASLVTRSKRASGNLPKRPVPPRKASSVMFFRASCTCSGSLSNSKNSCFRRFSSPGASFSVISGRRTISSPSSCSRNFPRKNRPVPRSRYTARIHRPPANARGKPAFSIRSLARGSVTTASKKAMRKGSSRGSRAAINSQRRKNPPAMSPAVRKIFFFSMGPGPPSCVLVKSVSYYGQM